MSGGHHGSLADYRRPGPVVVLDDDSAFLEMLGMTLPSDMDIRLYTDPDLCVEFLLRQVPFLETDAWAHREIIDQSRRGKSLIQLMAAYWAKHTERVGLAQVLMLDYSMPRGAGTRYLASLRSWPGRRVLLTGMDDMDAVEPFVRAGQIESVIHKQMTGMSKHLVSEIRALMASASTDIAHIWHNELTASQEAVLETRGVRKGLHELAQARCVEYVLLAKPFGVFGLDAAANFHWLHLTSAADLDAAATEAIRRGLPASVVQDVRSGAQVLDADLLEAVAVDRAASAYAAFSIGPGRRLFGAWIPVPEVMVKPFPYREWLASNRTRAVIEA